MHWFLSSWYATCSEDLVLLISSKESASGRKMILTSFIKPKYLYTIKLLINETQAIISAMNLPLRDNWL